MLLVYIKIFYIILDYKLWYFYRITPRAYSEKLFTKPQFRFNTVNFGKPHIWFYKSNQIKANQGNCKRDKNMAPTYSILVMGYFEEILQGKSEIELDQNIGE